MYTLYQKFVEQVKQQEINSYNERHRDYLIRAGKIQPQPKRKDARSQHARPRREQPRENIEETVRAVKPQQALAVSDQRPLKGSNGYNIPQEEHPYESKPIKPVANLSKQVQQTEQPKPRVENIRNPVAEQAPIINLPAKTTSTVINQERSPKINNELSEMPAEYEEVVLVECPEGCGKKFNERALEKHVKLCGKEVKRKVFQAKVVDDEAMELKKDEKPEKKAPKGIPKWKMESNRFRNALNQQKALESGAPPPPALPDVDERIECPGCGRKFNAEPAAKHIPLCVKRNSNKR